MTNNTTQINNGTYSSTDNNSVENINDQLVHTEKVHYGKVIMFRTNCPKCEETLFQPDLDFNCGICSHQFQGSIESLRIEVNSPSRSIPSPKIKEQILDQQDHKCYWCDREFDTTYFRYNSIRRLLPNWDHVIPFAYAQSNADENFVAACSICNSFKSSHIFENDGQCRAYLEQRWKKHLRLRKIVFLEGDFVETEKNCKKSTNTTV